ncbi:MAG: AsmA family protein [Sphingomonas sanxanigenens]|uniref:AsmA family protein n=1 Tax=Sphingomonas sanxanigenens TaxID=397260 RepID=A0A2W5AG72_9SPHN|nr:MAG: AsmA family protein [Sphingomonas sanxanigenens]
MKPARIALWSVGGIMLILLAALLAAALAPIGWLKPRVEKALSDSIGAPASIGAIERIDHFTLTPRIAIHDLAIAQPGWAGPGKLIEARTITIRLPLPPLIDRRVEPSEIAVDGLALNLIRDAGGRENWRRERKPEAEPGQPLRLETVRISNAAISYVDAKRNRRFNAQARFDRRGFLLGGTGAVLGAPVRIGVAGAPIGGGPAAPWPFAATIKGEALSMRASGVMDAPFDAAHMTVHVAASGQDLKYLDAIIEAGLPGTQPVTLSADARHDGRDWTVTHLAGTVGLSDLRGEVTVRKRDGRSIIEGRATSQRFDFDDLANARSRAIGAARRRKLGPRLIPDTAIDLKHMMHTDGHIDVSVARLLWAQPTPFVSLKTRIALDHGLLTVAPLTLTMPRGRLVGRMTVDQRRSDPPVMRLDLAMRGATLASLAGESDFSGELEARARLTGRGRRLRAAIGDSSGMVAITARDGELPARLASFIGMDIARGLIVSKDKVAGLRCLILRLDVANGLGRLNPLIIDTTRSQATISGTISLATEKLDGSAIGAPKKKSPLRYDKPLPFGGTIKNPVAFPPRVKKEKMLLRLLGKAIAGGQSPLATDADCNGLIARALAN